MLNEGSKESKTLAESEETDDRNQASGQEWERLSRKGKERMVTEEDQGVPEDQSRTEGAKARNQRTLQSKPERKTSRIPMNQEP